MGIELELENVSLQGVEGAFSSYGDPITPPGWTRHSDASLRNGIEFVTAAPMAGNILRDAIAAWYAVGYNYDCSPRTSTHIHLNLSTSDVDVLRSMIVLVYTIEDAIYRVVEESRKWAGYSMALSEMRPERLRNVLNSPTENVLRDAVVPRRNQERYYGFNFNVGRHGTVEFRYFPGAPSREQLESWLDLVTLIRKTSEQYTIQALESRINSEEDLRQFLLSNLGQWGERLFSAYSVSYLYAKFLDVMALAMDDSNPERQVSIVHMTPSLVTFIERNYCCGNEAAIQYIRQSAVSFPAMTQQDLTYFVQRCAELAGTPIISPGVWYSSDSDPFYNPDHVEDEEDSDYCEDEEDRYVEQTRVEAARIQQRLEESLEPTSPESANAYTPTATREFRLNSRPSLRETSDFSRPVTLSTPPAAGNPYRPAPEHYWLDAFADELYVFANETAPTTRRTP
jgi:hypothetical protein